MSTPYGARNYSGSAVATTIVGGITNASTSFSVVDGSSYPSTNFFCVIDEGLATEEKVFVGVRSGNAFSSVVRGDDGPASQAHSASATIRHIFTAQDAAEANAVASVLTTKGDSVGRTASAGWVRIPVGADGTLRVSRSSAASGQAWEAVPAELQTALNTVNDARYAPFALGVVGTHTLTSAFATIATHTTLQDEGLTLTASPPAGRRWKFTIVVNPYVPGGANSVNYRLLGGVTTLRDWTVPLEALSTTSSHAMTLVHTQILGAIGSTVFKVQVAAGTNSTSVTSFGSAAVLRQLIIEDIGAF